MPEEEEIKQQIIDSVDAEVDAWESFYKKFKDDYAKIAQYEKKIAVLEEELKTRDSFVKRKLEKERWTLIFFTLAFVVVTGFLLQIITSTLNVWLYFFGGLLIGLGSFSLLYLWTR